MTARTGRVPPPLSFANRNVLFSGGLRRALHRLDPVSYPFLPAGEQIRVRDRLQQLLVEVKADFSLYLANRAYPHRDYVARGMSMLDARHANPEPWRRHLEAQQHRLAELRAFAPEVYLASSLSPRTFELLRDMARAIRHPREATLLHGVQDVLRDEEGLLRYVLGAGGGARATTAEIQWLLRRAACRGLDLEPDADPHWRPAALEVVTADGRQAFQPLRTSVERFTDVPVDPHSTYIRVETGLPVPPPVEEAAEAVRALIALHGAKAPQVAEAEKKYIDLVARLGDGSSFQCFLMLGQVPDEVWFPHGAEFLHAPLDRVDFPVDVVVHARHIDNPKAVEWARKKVVDADVAVDEQARGAGAATSDAEDNQGRAAQLAQDVKDPSRPPLYFASIAFCISAPTLDLLKARRQEFRHHLSDVRLELPVGKQLALYCDHLLRCDGGQFRDYEDVFTPKQLASMMPTATHAVGHGEGHYFAHVAWGARRPVHHDIRRANRTNRPPSILIVGDQGSGKTVTALAAFVRPAVLTGSIAVDFDPKGDHHWERLVEFDGMVDVVRVMADDDSADGMLDPLVISPPAMKRTRAAAFLWDLLPAPEPRWQTAIMRMVSRVVNLETDPTCVKVVRALKESGDEHDQDAGEALETWAEFGPAKLGFAEHGRDVSAKAPLTVIKARGLVLPRPGLDYRADPERRTSVAALKLISTFQTALIYDHPGHKVLVFDEAWWLFRTDDGRHLIDEQNHMLRALNGVLILLSQGALDAGETESLVGERLTGRAQTRDEAGRMLALHGLDPNDQDLVAWLRGCSSGRFLYGDLDNRVGAVQVDIVEPGVLAALDTTPDRDRPGVEVA